MPKTTTKTDNKAKIKRQPQPKKTLPKDEISSYSEEEYEVEPSPVLEDSPKKNTTKETRGRKKKYSTPEEAHEARLEQMRQWRQRRKNSVISISTPNNDIKNELMGILGQSVETSQMTPELRKCLVATLQAYPQN